ncbi:MAG TPA: carbon-nitrogen hydrolase family protein [Chthonomonadaceae bacterium]|nr:carbon-nitrogen hydrolase family protein [Chthonomonadaceae bacterium]
MRLRVAGAQIPVTNDIAANVATLCRAIDYAASEGADVLLTPEGSLSGYTHEFDTRAAQDALAIVTSKAAGVSLALALGTCFVEPEDGRCYNQIRFYAREGDYLGFHSKTLTCGTLTDPPVGEINHFAVRPLQTFRLQDVPVGGLICNDLWANPTCTPMPDPHLTQQLALQGARILFHAVNGGRGGEDSPKLSWAYHEANLQLRAIAGKLWIVTVDNCFPEDRYCSSPSGILDPQGNWVVKTAPKGEALFAYTIEL